MQQDQIDVTGGVDTHLETHVAAVVDQVGRILGTAEFPATRAGYGRLLRWLGRHGRLVKVGIEGSGSYGAGLARHLAGHGVEVIEVNRPNRQARRRRGKSDTADAEAAARAALNGEATATPKRGGGPVEAIRVLRLARRSAMKARTQAANQIRDVLVNGPDELRARLGPLEVDERVAICARFRVGDDLDTAAAVKASLRFLARRHQALSAEIAELDARIRPLCAAANPALLGAHGVGPEVAAALLVAAGDNPDRMRSEAAFAALCGVSPVEASSGKITRHRLNSGGNRQANNALWRIVMVRLSCCDRTRTYAQRRQAEGLSRREIIRCLKRHVAREIYRLLVNPTAVPNGTELRTARQHARLTLATAATELSSWPIALSRLERCLDHDTELALRYQAWLHQQPTTLTA